MKNCCLCENTLNFDLKKQIENLIGGDEIAFIIAVGKNMRHFIPPEGVEVTRQAVCSITEENPIETTQITGLSSSAFISYRGSKKCCHIEDGEMICVYC
jgi:hypothetical protein